MKSVILLALSVILLSSCTTTNQTPSERSREVRESRQHSLY